MNTKHILLLSQVLWLMSGAPSAVASARPIVAPRPNAAPVMANPVALNRVTSPVALASVTPKVVTGAGARATSTGRPACPTSACPARKNCPPCGAGCGLRMPIQVSTSHGGATRSPDLSASARPTTSENQNTKVPAAVSAPTLTPMESISRGPVPQVSGPTAESLAAQAVKLAEADRRVLAVQLKRAEDNCPQAQYDLALRYFTGRGVEVDEAQALAWLERSAKNGHSLAEKKLTALDAKRQLDAAGTPSEALPGSQPEPEPDHC